MDVARHMKRRSLLHAGLQLSLFDLEPYSAPKSGATPPPDAAPAPHPSSLSPATPPSVLPPPPPSIEPSPPQPRPRRRLMADDHLIEYELRRSRRRSIGFTIEDEGLRVTAPRWVTLAEIEEAIRSKQRWIVRKLQQQEQRARQQHAPMRWADGASIPYLGRRLALRLSLHPGAPASGGDATLDADDHLHLPLAPDASEADVRESAHGWLREQARKIFAERLPRFAAMLGVSYRSHALSGATTQWGSCNARGVIRLNWQLIHLPADLVDYVIVHELAHLREMNHSPRFWSVVESVLPDYRHARRQMREHAPGRHGLR